MPFGHNVDVDAGEGLSRSPANSALSTLSSLTCVTLYDAFHIAFSLPTAGWHYYF
ncbi:hypothetical protein ACEZPQ_000766 [Klebsiella aerogenes]